MICDKIFRTRTNILVKFVYYTNKIKYAVIGFNRCRPKGAVKITDCTWIPSCLYSIQASRNPKASDNFPTHKSSDLSTTISKHIPVLLDKVIETLGDISGKTVVDCTFGAGGYTRAFLDAGANVIAYDRDITVLSTAVDIEKQYPDRFKFINKPFSDIVNLGQKVDAVVFDFGISSMQIDTPERGFSFRFDAPLDMRMSNYGPTAAEIIEDLSAAEIANILKKYGDLKKSGILANAMKKALPKTTFELKELIYDPRDVAPVFQALRIFVNDELGEIESAINSVPDVLLNNGICACVSFHSIEDRLVKSIFREWTTSPGDPRMPVLKPAPFKLLKTFTPNMVELENNPRARSAHLRAVVKTD